MGLPLTGISILSLFYLAAISENESALDDTSLARRIRDGDKKAFRQFYERQVAPLHRFLLKKGIPKEQAHETIQQAFVQLWEHRHRIKPGSRLRSYLFKIAFNSFLNENRSSKRWVHRDSFAGEPANDQKASPDNPELDSMHHQLLSKIETLVHDLPEQQRHVFELCFMEQLSYREAAEVLGLQRKTVENHMGKALKRLREGLHDFL